MTFGRSDDGVVFSQTSHSLIANEVQRESNFNIPSVVCFVQRGTLNIITIGAEDHADGET